MNEPIWGRFELIDEKQEIALLDLISKKGLKREDLMLILKTIRIRTNDNKDMATMRIDIENIDEVINKVEYLNDLLDTADKLLNKLCREREEQNDKFHYN